MGLLKDRDESDRHHALDAAVVAACSHGMVKRLADYSRLKQLVHARDGFVDVETGEIVNRKMFDRLEMHFPAPWEHFRSELQARMRTREQEQLRTEIKVFGTYSEDDIRQLKPLFVSRAVQRRSKGPLHEQTLRSPKLIDSGQSCVRIDIKKLKLSSLEKIVGANDPRNATLIAALRERLIASDDNGEKAFTEPFMRPSALGKTAPVVRSVKLISTQNSGVNVGHAIADLGPMLNVRVYRLPNGKFFIDPVYGMSSNRRINVEPVPPGADFQFSLTKNEYVSITIGREEIYGYFVMYENDGRVTLRGHDQPQPDKKYFRKTIANAASIQKFNVDILGNIYLASTEIDCGLA